MSVHCYAYWSFDSAAPHPTTIECNFAKSEIRGQPQLDTFCEFVEALGRAVRKPLLVADEGLVHPIMRYEPATGELLRLVYEPVPERVGLLARARALLADRVRSRAS